MRSTARLYRLITGKLKSPSRSSPSYLIAILVSLAMLATPVFSHSGDALMGTILGTVSTIGPDGQKYNAQGAKVRLESTAQTSSLFEVADNSGEFKFGSLPPGSYDLEVALEGFKDTARIITIHAGETAVENIELEVKSGHEDVTIKSTRGGVDAVEAKPAREWKQANLQTVSLGNERFHQNALPLIPVVVRGSGLMKIKSSQVSQSGLRIDRTMLMNYAWPRGKLTPSCEGPHFTNSDIINNPSNTNASPHFVSARNGTVHLPRFPSLQTRVLRRSLGITVSPKVSLKRNHLYPRDFRGNMDGANFETYSNGIARMFGIRFVIEKK